MIHEQVLEYPTNGHERLHGPSGYVDYKSFKPWLRDEFRFRCVSFLSGKSSRVVPVASARRKLRVHKGLLRATTNRGNAVRCRRPTSPHPN